MPKTQVDQLGTKRDEARRVKQARDSNDQSYRVRTEIARDRIYMNGKGVKSKQVEDLLSSDSLTPTKVRAHTALVLDSSCNSHIFLEHICTTLRELGNQYISHVRR